MEDLLISNNEKYKTLTCCHTDNRDCECYKCLQDGFYQTPESYNCAKKLNCYVLNYVPSFTSEIIHYLNNSKILETNFIDKTVNILSLGCGCATDLMALNFYINTKKLNIKIKYHGIDKSDLWLRKTFENATFEQKDVLIDGLDLSDVDIVFINKLFSTLHTQNFHNEFIQILTNSIQNQLKTNSFLIFNDINSNKKGRDIFDKKISKLFNTKRRYFFTDCPYFESHWLPISDKKIFFNIPDNLSYRPSSKIGKVIIFEYKK